MRQRRVHQWIPSLVFLLATAVLPGCRLPDGSIGLPFFHFTSPLFEQLSLLGDVDVELVLPRFGRLGDLELRVDGTPVDPSLLNRGPHSATATLAGLGEGVHALEADAELRLLFFRFDLAARTSLELRALTLPDECEILNEAECLLPYPSARFLEPDPSTPGGLSLAFPAAGMPRQVSMSSGLLEPVSPEPFRKLDGFSPTVQVLMHFPDGVDVEASNASRLLPGSRSYGTRSLDPDSPTLLIDAHSGEHLLHFVEVDVRAPGVDRQVLFLRPGQSLAPGRRYIVAVRNLVSPGGGAVEPEAPFAVLRDRRPTTIAALEARRRHFEHLFRRLARAGVPRDDLVLAFDFVTQSDEGLSWQMLSMRDQAFDWLDAQIAAGVQTFGVDEVVTEDTCLDDGRFTYRTVRGTFEVPLFLTEDPELDEPRANPQVLTEGVLNVDAGGAPVPNGFTNPVYTIGIPCRLIAPENAGVVFRPILLGHGLFGTGRGMVEDMGELGELLDAYRAQGLFEGEFDYLTGGTDWRGLSSREIQSPPGTSEVFSWIVTKVIRDFSKFDRLADRLRQGQLNALVLARMMREGAFNLDPAFRHGGEGVFPGPDEEMFYFGASLGGIMGLMFSALTPDVERLNVDVPAINFSLLLQRATPFITFQDILPLTGISDPIHTALGIGLIHELWVRSEPAGYARHITSDPYPGTNAKRILLTEAFLDQQVSNQATEIAARTLRLPVIEGSLRSGLAGLEDRPGPLDSAYVTYDTGSLDLGEPAHEPFIPPLANRQPTPAPENCDPHGRRGLIPASLQQLVGFLEPGGRIESFCDGICDGRDSLTGDPSPLELPQVDPACSL